MHPITVDHTDLVNIRVLVLSLSSARLFANEASKSHGSRYSLFVSNLSYYWYRFKLSFSHIKQRLCMALFNGSGSLNDDKHHPAQRTVPKFMKVELNFLEDIVSYIIQGQYDLILLQEIYNEQIFIQLAQMFKDCRYHLYSHFQKLYCHDVSIIRKDSGLAVFSRWPITSTQCYHFNKLNGKNMFGWNDFGWKSHRDDSLYLSNQLNKANGVQYVLIDINYLTRSNQSEQTMMIHLFNVDLLHYSFVPVNRDKSIGNEPFSARFPIHHMIRLSQAYELAKLINIIGKIGSKNNDQLILVGGHFGEFDDGDSFGMINQISIQDILQTYVDQLYNAFQSPERMSSPNETLKSRISLLNCLKSEQLFFKFISSKNVSNGHDCMVEFIHSKIKLDSFHRSIVGNMDRILMRPMIELPRAIHFRIIDDIPETKINQIEFHTNWLTFDRKLKVVESLESLLNRFKTKLQINLFRKRLFTFLLMFLILLIFILMQMDLNVFIFCVVLILLYVYKSSCCSYRQFTTAEIKLKSLLNELCLDRIHLSRQTNEKQLDNNCWLNYYKEKHITSLKVKTPLATAEESPKNVDGENNISNKVSGMYFSRISSFSTTTF